MSARSGMVMTAQAVVAHYKRIGAPIPPEVRASLSPVMLNEGNHVIAHGKRLRQPKRPNKTEAEFELILRSRRIKDGNDSWPEFETVTFEGATLRLADGLTYKPDYMCARRYHYAVARTRDPSPLLLTVHFFEVKGKHKWDDAIAKFKMAREIHKWAHFEMWQKIDGHWDRLY